MAAVCKRCKCPISAHEYRENEKAYSCKVCGACKTKV